MSWLTYNLTPVDDKSQDFLRSYYSHNYELLDTLTQYRSDKYNKQEKLFEIDLDLMGSGRSDIDVPELPYSQIRSAISINAELWKKEIYRTINSHEFQIDSRHISIDHQRSMFPFGILYWSDYSIVDNTLLIKTNFSNIYKFHIEATNTILGSIPTGTVAKLIPEKQQLDIHVGDKDSNTLKEIQEGPFHEFAGQKRPEILAKIIAAYENILPSVQIEIKETGQSTQYKQMFDMLGLFWEEPREGVYLITNSVRYRERIETFLEKPKQNRSLTEYYDLLGYPIDCAERIQKLSGDYDLISGEEFILYGMQNGDISDELATYISYVPYRPKPTIASVHQALIYTRDIIQDMKEASHVINQLNDQSPEHIIEEYEREQGGSRWSDLDVNYPLHNPSQKQTYSIEGRD